MLNLKPQGSCPLYPGTFFCTCESKSTSTYYNDVASKYCRISNAVFLEDIFHLFSPFRSPISHTVWRMNIICINLNLVFLMKVTEIQRGDNNSSNYSIDTVSKVT